MHVIWVALAASWIGMRTLSSLYFGCRPEKVPQMLFNEEHFNERYSLILLIFMGEVVAAGGVPSSGTAAVLPVSAVCTAFLCFLLAFVAQPRARRNPFDNGVVSGIHAPHGCFAMACALAAMGPAFSRIIEAASEGSDEAGGSGGGEHRRLEAPPDESASGGEGSEDREADTVVLLYVSAGAFVLASAWVHALGADKPAARARCSQRVRVGVQAAVGLLVALLALVPHGDASLAAALVPALLAPLTLFELWASASATGEQQRVGHVQQPP